MRFKKLYKFLNERHACVAALRHVEKSATIYDLASTPCFTVWMDWLDKEITLNSAIFAVYNSSLANEKNKLYLAVRTICANTNGADLFHNKYMYLRAEYQNEVFKLRVQLVEALLTQYGLDETPQTLGEANEI